jgi:hypothetical protein
MPFRNVNNLILTGAIALLSASVCSGHPHPDSAPPADTNRALFSAGKAAPKFEYVKDRLVLPDSVKMRHGHGLCRDGAGNIYFNFEPESISAETRTLVRFAPDGTDAVLLGTTNTLAYGVPHGLNIEIREDGKTLLYHAHNEALIHCTTLDGDIVWSQKWGAQMGNFKPTDVLVPAGSSRVLVADGYGSSMIHALKKADGVYDGKSWGGLGTAHGEFNCPHGITYDPRKNLLLVADRGNQRLEYYTTNGIYHSTVQVPELTAPCNADVQGDYVLVPDLNGPVVILDGENRTLQIVELSKLLGDRGFKHPHDAIWLANGDFVVCTWNPGRLAYFRRLPN